MRSSIRFSTLVTIVSLALTLSACGSGSAGTGGGTSSRTGTATAAPIATGAGATTGVGPGGTPEDGAKIVVDAVLTGKDLTGLICSAQVDNLKQTLAAVAQPDVSVDISGLTFQTSFVKGNTAQVAVSGKMKLTTQGKSVDVPAPWTSMTMQNENGWKFCSD